MPPPFDGLLVRGASQLPFELIDASQQLERGERREEGWCGKGRGDEQSKRRVGRRGAGVGGSGRRECSRKEEGAKGRRGGERRVRWTVEEEGWEKG